MCLSYTLSYIHLAQMYLILHWNCQSSHQKFNTQMIKQGRGKTIQEVMSSLISWQSAKWGIQRERPVFQKTRQKSLESKMLSISGNASSQTGHYLQLPWTIQWLTFTKTGSYMPQKVFTHCEQHITSCSQKTAGGGKYQKKLKVLNKLW
jgi:hypothetical protein